MNNSYSEMKDHDIAIISASIHESEFSEWVVPSFEKSSPEANIVLKALSASAERLREYDNQMEFPNKPVRIVVKPSQESNLHSVEDKFPIGMLKVCDEEIYAVVDARKELFAYISHNLSSTAEGEMALTIHLPFLKKYELESYYPIMEYGINIIRRRA